MCSELLGGKILRECIMHIGWDRMSGEAWRTKTHYPHPSVWHISSSGFGRQIETWSETNRVLLLPLCNPRRCVPVCVYIRVKYLPPALMHLSADCSWSIIQIKSPKPLSPQICGLSRILRLPFIGKLFFIFCHCIFLVFNSTSTFYSICRLILFILNSASALFILCRLIFL